MKRSNVALVSLCFIVLAVSEAQSQSCPEKNGRFANPGQCDSYTECTEGVPEEKLCPDGLFFNDKVHWSGYPCGYPNEVDCAQRARSQIAQPTDECPHQFGYYKMGDSSHCSQFMNCAHGRGFLFDCPEDLAFNSETYRCEWPDETPDCDAESFLQFRCPPNPNQEFQPQPDRKFPHPTNCQKYYVCGETNRPRLLSCGEGFGFNPETTSCEDRENVSTCY